MDIVLIIQLLHETAAILLCLWILWVSNSERAQQRWLVCFTMSGAAVRGDSHGWKMNHLWVSVLVCLVPGWDDLGLGSMGSVSWSDYMWPLHIAWVPHSMMTGL